MGRLLSESSVAVSLGPESVMRTRRPSQPDPTGRAKAEEALPSPSAVSAISKLSESNYPGTGAPWKGAPS